MARPTKVFSALENAAPSGERSADPAALAARFRSLHESFLRWSVQAMRELGGILEEASRSLRGDYSRWVQELCISLSTARNYRALARLAEEDLNLFEECADLGPTKLLRLARVPGADRARVVRGLGDRAREITDVELARECRPYLPVSPTPSSRPDALPKSLSAIAGWMQAATKVPPSQNLEVRRAVLTELPRIERSTLALRRRWAVRPTKPTRPRAPARPSASPATKPSRTRAPARPGASPATKPSSPRTTKPSSPDTTTQTSLRLPSTVRRLPVAPARATPATPTTTTTRATPTRSTGTTARSAARRVPAKRKERKKQ